MCEPRCPGRTAVQTYHWQTNRWQPARIATTETDKVQTQYAVMNGTTGIVKTLHQRPKMIASFTLNGIYGTFYNKERKGTKKGKHTSFISCLSSRLSKPGVGVTVKVLGPKILES